MVLECGMTDDLRAEKMSSNKEFVRRGLRGAGRILLHNVQWDNHSTLL